MAFSAGSKYSDGGVVNQTSAALTLTSADSGKVYRINVADCIVALPATEMGLFYHFIVDTVSSSTGCSLSPVAADNVNGGTDNKDLINTPGTDVKGDSVTLIGDGSEGWLTMSMHGIWAEES